MEALFSAQGKVLINALACTVFVLLIWVSLSRQRIDLGSIPPKILKRENPRAFWAVVGLYAAIALWTGVAAIVGLS